MKKVIYLLSGLALLVVSNVYAAIDYKSGPYVGGQLGGSIVDEGSGYGQYINTSSVGNFTGIGWRAYAGYSFTPFLSLESGYSSYYKVKYTSSAGNIQLSTYTIDLVGKLTLPLGKISDSLSHFSVYGKGGGAYVNMHTDMSTPTVAVSKTVGTIRPTYGAGIIFSFNDNIAIDLSWMGILGRARLKPTDNAVLAQPVPNCNLFTFGLAYKFTGMV